MMNPTEMPATEPAWYAATPIWTWALGGVVAIIVLSFLVKVVRQQREKKLLEEIGIYCQPDNLAIMPSMALVAVVGHGMSRERGVAARVFGALAGQGINIRMISQGASELNILVGVENRDFEQAVQAIYDAFVQGEEK